MSVVSIFHGLGLLVTEEILSRYSKLKSVFDSMDFYTESLFAQNRELANQNEALAARNRALYEQFVTSTSWKITKPLRAIKRIFSR
jgi:hypothetical protein